MNKNANELLIVKPRSKKSFKGSMNIKKILYAELNEKLKQIDFEHLTDADRELIKKRDDVAHMLVVIDSILPDEYYKELKTLQYRVKALYKAHCVSDDSAFMTRAHWEAMKEEIVPYVEECHALIDKISNNWDFVLEAAAQRLYNVAEGKITIEDAQRIVERKAPSIKQFTQSYDNVFCYTVSPMTSSVMYFNASSNETEEGDEFYLNEINNLMKTRLLEVVQALDSMLYKREMAKYTFDDKVVVQPRKRLNACARILDRFTEAFQDEMLIDFSKRITSISALGPNEDYILYEESEYLCMDILSKMYTAKLLKEDEYPEDLMYMKKEKYIDMIKEKEAVEAMNGFQFHLELDARA